MANDSDGLDPLPVWHFPGWYVRGSDAGADAAVAAFDARNDQLTKPRGALGLLEALGRRLAAIQRAALPVARPAACLIFVSDHPVAARGVSAYPREVTRAMVANFAGGGAAASVLCRRADVPLAIVDVGVDGGPVSLGRGATAYRRAPVAELPAGDLVDTDAMPPATYRAALLAGMDAVDRVAGAGDVRVLVIGEMGIGNTTCAAAVTAALTGADGDALAALVGPGTGVDGAALAAKRAVVAAAVRRVRATGPVDGHRAVQALGGRDLAAMMGAMARAVERRIVVIVDGYIASASALALCTIAPAAGAGLVFGHRSREPGHRHQLEAFAALGGGDALWARPLVELDLALGEGSGALVALPVLEAACALHAGMATFGEAAVPDREAPR
ncbi:MAG TPA: nicotinate-nucleotide--dimethylbenzimidazole phosphoribosyltransferase [Kofleriaceae bacterium]|nr:nicotinate-nucleotide--dimethylbenzimidazole phosphoribosyltransferase [Kofleriaceae bacterium]